MARLQQQQLQHAQRTHADESSHHLLPPTPTLTTHYRCQTHGFPRVIGVLTHLDSFHNITTLRRVKRQLKHRFWTDIYEECKLFYLSGLKHGRYPKAEVTNLARFISVLKFRPLVWRNSHPSVLADRVEDVTAPHLIQADATCNRTIVSFGYVRGTFLKAGQRVHVPGLGDYSMAEVTAVEDPCPFPSGEKKRRLNQKEKVSQSTQAKAKAPHTKQGVRTSPKPLKC